MFECGVQSDSDLTVEAHGSQQNGAILGNGCALFLCKFTSRLIQCYNEKAWDQGIDVNGDLDLDLYSTALTEILQAYRFEDCTEHGRLLVLKDFLASLSEQKQLSDEQLASIYCKDIASLR